MCCLTLKILHRPLPVDVLRGCYRPDFMDKTMDKLSPPDRSRRRLCRCELSYKCTKPAAGPRCIWPSRRCGCRCPTRGLEPRTQLSETVTVISPLSSLTFNAFNDRAIARPSTVDSRRPAYRPAAPSRRFGLLIDLQVAVPSSFFAQEVAQLVRVLPRCWHNNHSPVLLGDVAAAPSVTYRTMGRLSTLDRPGFAVIGPPG
jgi:hypothetical protein